MHHIGSLEICGHPCAYLADWRQPLQLHAFIWAVRISALGAKVHALNTVLPLENIRACDAICILVEETPTHELVIDPVPFTIRLYIECDISLKIIGELTDGFIHRGLEAP